MNLVPNTHPVERNENNEKKDKETKKLPASTYRIRNVISFLFFKILLVFQILSILAQNHHW